MLKNSIIVGIPTDGKPLIEKQGDLFILKNMLIGKDFHWQQSIEAVLPGDIEVREDADFPVLNRLPLETYLECVVGSEMNPGAPEEFLKAHAVISRSWAVGKILKLHDKDEVGKVSLPEEIISWEDTCDHHGFDVCSDDHCQRYQGLQPIPPRVADAIKATEGEILISAKGNLVDARFSKCCGGLTEVFSSCWQPQEQECIVSLEDPWCNLKELPEEARHRLLQTILKDYDLLNDGGYEWETNVTAEDIESNLSNKFGRNIGKIQDVEVITRGSSGRAVTMKLTGSDGTLKIGKELMIRRLLASTHLYSSWIDIVKIAPGEWKIIGRGWGHGVGLCQIGAANMALNGYTYKEILSFYYPGSTIGNLKLLS